jgi:hypothetical protein
VVVGKDSITFGSKELIGILESVAKVTQGKLEVDLAP